MEVTILRWRSTLRLVLFMAFVAAVEPHGRLIEPPSRSTMWR